MQKTYWNGKDKTFGTYTKSIFIVLVVKSFQIESSPR